MKKPEASGAVEATQPAVLSVREANTKKKPASQKTKTPTSAKKSSTPKQKSPRAKSGTRKAPSPHKTNPTDVLGKSIVIESTSSLSKKLQIVDNISSRKAPPKREKRQLTMPSLAEFKTNIHLALLSPFRTQVNHSLIASGIARYAGAAFVLIGGIFTLYGMHVLTTGGYQGTSHLLAQTCIPGTTCVETPGTLPDTTLTTPSATIGINTSSTELRGDITVTVTVPGATRVDLLAVDASTGVSETIRTLESTSDVLWQGKWDTRQFDDGTYTLKAVIVNQYGSYTTLGTVNYTLNNYNVTTESSGGDAQASTTVSGGGSATTTSSGVSQTGTTQTASTSAPVSTVLPTSNVPFSVRFSSQEPLVGNVRITTETEGALSVKHFYRPKSSSAYTVLGNANYKSATKEWEYDFDTTRLQVGVYNIRTQVVYPNNVIELLTTENVDIERAASQATTSESDVSAQLSTNAIPPPINPSISLDIPRVGPLEKSIDIFIRTPDASFVELSLIREGSLTPRFLGLGTPAGTGVWKYRFDTTQIPNGTHFLVAKVRHTYGDSESEPVRVEIQNTVPSSESPEKDAVVGAMSSLGKEVIVGFASDDTAYSGASSTGVQGGDSSSESDGTTRKDPAIVAYEEQSQVRAREYAEALRNERADEAEAVLVNEERDRDAYIASLVAQNLPADEVSRIKDILQKAWSTERTHIERSERIIRERIGAARFDDSDKDGISNYDEVNLYNTNPFHADTDQDGFTDGAEVTSGYNPTDSAREAYIVYESPKETGVVREDILEVTSVATLETSVSTGKPKAYIAGRALPHSFVTLYIFSTPIVVTVKADDNGAWSYIFDKELEDGSHEVYVGMTDNAGRIVAKSAPFEFIKTAQAFTQIDAEASIAPAQIEAASPSLLSGSVAFVIGSLAIVSLGLVLILLGMHVRPRHDVVVAAT